jgi:outer membrane protein OmpA-like peptidoglycan-associated protein
VLAVLGIGAVLVTRARADACTATNDKIIFASQVTAEEGSDPAPPAGLVAQADRYASCGGGQLVLIQAAGLGGVQAGGPVSLRIDREPGQVEHDAIARQLAVSRLLAQAFATARKSRPPGTGRDVIGLLATVSHELGPGQNDVWLRTLGLPTVDPANAGLLMAADPAQAVASIAGHVPSLRGARVRLILSPPAGDQPRFNVVTDAWRRAFMVALLRNAGADVVSVSEVESMERPAPLAPAAPVIANLPDPTPRLTPAPKPRPGRVYRAKLDTSTLFRPDSARFMTGQRQILAQLDSMVRAWRTGWYSTVAVVGHCARFGPARTAVQLSQQRADEVASLLRSRGVSRVTAIGVGFSQPLPPGPRAASNRVVVITAMPKS